MGARKIGVVESWRKAPKMPKRVGSGYTYAFRKYIAGLKGEKNAPRAVEDMSRAFKPIWEAMSKKEKDEFKKISERDRAASRDERAKWMTSHRGYVIARKVHPCGEPIEDAAEYGLQPKSVHADGWRKYLAEHPGGDKKAVGAAWLALTHVQRRRYQREAWGAMPSKVRQKYVREVRKRTPYIEIGAPATPAKPRRLYELEMSEKKPYKTMEAGARREKLAAEWDALDEAQKKTYEDKYAAAKAEYDVARAEYDAFVDTLRERAKADAAAAKAAAAAAKASAAEAKVTSVVAKTTATVTETKPKAKAAEKPATKPAAEIRPAPTATETPKKRTRTAAAEKPEKTETEAPKKRARAASTSEPEKTENAEETKAEAPKRGRKAKSA